MQRTKNLVPSKCISVSPEPGVENGEVLNYPRGCSPAEERHHEIVEVCAYVVIPSDTESEVGCGNDGFWPSCQRIRTEAEVGKVREPRMIWENQIEHKFRRDRGPSSGADVSKDSHTRRGRDSQVNQHPPDIACVVLLEV